jgi:acyl-homoserine lactone synthase
MKLTLIHGCDADRHPALMDQIWRLRFQTFAVDYGWTLPMAAEGRERDQFDTDDTIHFALCEGERLIVYSRLNPTIGPNLLADVYPHMAAEIPQRETTLEWSRLCVPRAIRGRRPSGFHSMLRHVIAYALDAGADEISLQGHPDWILSFERIGIPTRPIGLGAVLDGTPIVPFIASISDGSVAALDHLMVQPALDAARSARK